MRVRAVTRCLGLGGSALACLLGWQRGAAAFPPPSPAPGAAEGRGARSELVLRIEGPLEPAGEAALASVLLAELGPLGVRSSLVRSSEPLASWLVARARDPGLLVVAVLDVREPAAWQLSLVDAARGRAIRRELRSGVATDAASYEAVASVLASAAAALKDGLEVASRPIGEIAPDPRPLAEPPQVPAQATSTPELREPAEASARVFAELGVGVASLSDAAAVSAALGAALGLRTASGWGARARGAVLFGTRITTELGHFEVERRDLELSLGRAHHFGVVALEPTLGLRAELVRRTESVAADGVRARADESAWRFGPAASARLRLALARWAALELSGNAAYYPRDIRYVAQPMGSQGSVELAHLSHFSLGAELGISIQSAP